MNYDQSTAQRTAGITLIIISALFIIAHALIAVRANLNYERTYSQLWSLADKSSTIPAKERYIAQFVEALKAGYVRGDFATHNAIFLQTPDNSFSSNLEAVETLTQRLKEIQEMDPKTFEYNTAIQQITAQEQGQAHSLLRVMEGCYCLKSYMLVWSWIGLIAALAEVTSIVIGIALLLDYYDVL